MRLEIAVQEAATKVGSRVLGRSGVGALQGCGLFSAPAFNAAPRDAAERAQDAYQPHTSHPQPSTQWQAEALQAQLETLAGEKAAAFDARVQAESRLSALEAELADACSEMEQAKRTGTPKGAGGQGGAARRVMAAGRLLFLCA